MENPNSFTQVKVISNPIKSLVCHHTFTQHHTSAECRIFREVLDLSRGVWQVAVSHIVVKSIDRDVRTIFDVKTNLAHTVREIDGRAVSINECLATFECNCPQNTTYFFSPPSKVFFTVQNNPNDSFRLSLVLNELMDKNTIFTIKAEFRLLFQRMI